ALQLGQLVALPRDDGVALLDQLGQLGDLTGAQVRALGGPAGGGEQQARGEGDHRDERSPGRQPVASEAGGHEAGGAEAAGHLLLLGASHGYLTGPGTGPAARAGDPKAGCPYVAPAPSPPGSLGWGSVPAGDDDPAAGREFQVAQVQGTQEVGLHTAGGCAAVPVHPGPDPAAEPALVRAADDRPDADRAAVDRRLL